MAICKLDEKGYCERHKTIHIGRHLEISQDTSLKGEMFRNYWDQVYGIVTALPMSTRFNRCKYKGELTEERESCSTCPGNVRLKIYKCNYPGEHNHQKITADYCNKICKENIDD